MPAIPRVVLWSAIMASACGGASPSHAPASALLFPGGAIVDLSHSYGKDTLFWPTSDPFRLDVVADGITPGGYYYASNNVFTSEHGGTHVDAPVHFARGRQTVDAIPLERLIGPAAVVDVSAAAAENADYLVSVSDLAAYETAHGPLPDGVILLVRTGFSSRWPDAARYLGTAQRGPEAVRNLHFPGLDPGAAEWLVAHRAIAAVGIDTASIDHGQSADFRTHRALAEANIPALENLTGLDRLPVTGAYLVALPMKIAGGSGAPVRVIAIVPSGD